MVFPPKFPPINAKATKNKVELTTNVINPIDNFGKIALITIAAPVTPPAAKLFGEKKYSTPIATNIIPIVISVYSFNIKFFIFLPPSL
ncbi:hypothetical protein CNEO3_140062 [Clostridium neonatale]|nr:hypothetical protein CNEO3_140062 [Clostridium neonatale]